MWQTPKKVQTVFMIMLIIGFSIPIASFLVEYIPNPKVYQERKDFMKKEYDNIDLPINTVEVEKNTYNKITRIWISGKYSVTMKKEEIELYYMDEMRRKEWTYEKTNINNEMNFKKNNLLIVIVPYDNKFSMGIYYNGGGPNF